MTAAADVITRTRGYLMTGQRDVLNQLAASIDATQENLTFSRDMRTLKAGARISIGLETMYVWSTTTSGATVMRGAEGTTATTHAQGDLVRVNSQTTDSDILAAVNDVLGGLSSPERGLFQVRSTSFTFNPSIMGYDLGPVGDVLDVWKVRYESSGPEKDWPVIPRSLWRFEQAADTTDFVSGKQLVLLAQAEAGRDVRVSYKLGFTALAALDDDLATDAGLHTEAHDIVPLGAAIRLMAGRDIKRTHLDAQPEPRRAEEVPPGSASQAMRPLLALFDERVSEERGRLARRWP
jgi:hypothetical protein